MLDQTRHYMNLHWLNNIYKPSINTIYIINQFIIWSICCCCNFMIWVSEFKSIHGRSGRNNTLFFNLGLCSGFKFNYNCIRCYLKMAIVDVWWTQMIINMVTIFQLNHKCWWYSKRWKSRTNKSGVSTTLWWKIPNSVTWVLWFRKQQWWAWMQGRWKIKGWKDNNDDGCKRSVDKYR